MKTTVKFLPLVTLILWVWPTIPSLALDASSTASSTPPSFTASSTSPLPDLRTLVEELYGLVQSLQARNAELQAEVQELKVRLSLSRTLARKSSGEEVKQLQEMLREVPDVYPEGLVTGYFGELTEKAVVRFQKKYALEPAGIVGPKTREKFFEITLQNESLEVVPDNSLADLGLSSTTLEDILSSSTEITSNATSKESAPESTVSSSTNLSDVNASSTATTTVSSDTAPPILFNGMPVGTLPAGTTSATLSVTTDKDAICAYTTSPGVDYANMASFSTNKGTSHSTTVSGLQNSTTYMYYLSCEDVYGNINPDDYVLTFSVAADKTPPILSNILATNITTSTAQITWQTNKPADSQVAYGQTSSYGTLTPLVTTLVTSHSVWLSGLSKGTNYHYQVESRDAAGNLATSTDQVFSTASK